MAESGNGDDCFRKSQTFGRRMALLGLERHSPIGLCDQSKPSENADSRS